MTVAAGPLGHNEPLGPHAARHDALPRYSHEHGVQVELQRQAQAPLSSPPRVVDFDVRVLSQRTLNHGHPGERVHDNVVKREMAASDRNHLSMLGRAVPPCHDVALLQRVLPHRRKTTLNEEETARAGACEGLHIAHIVDQHILKHCHAWGRLWCPKSCLVPCHAVCWLPVIGVVDTPLPGSCMDCASSLSPRGLLMRRKGWLKLCCKDNTNAKGHEVFELLYVRIVPGPCCVFCAHRRQHACPGNNDFARHAAGERIPGRWRRGPCGWRPWPRDIAWHDARGRGRSIAYHARDRDRWRRGPCGWRHWPRSIAWHDAIDGAQTKLHLQLADSNERAEHGQARDEDRGAKAPSQH